MLNEKQVALVEKYAMGAVLSLPPRMTYAEFVEELGQDNIPEEVVVYKLYEDLDSHDLLEAMEEQYDIFQAFAKQVVEAN